jgi:hypothetical protein
MSERGTKSRKSTASKPPPKAAAAKSLALKEPPKSAAKPRSARRGAAPTESKAAAPRQAAAVGGAAALDAPSLMARVIRLESERDRLQAALEKSEIRIRELEDSREQVVNRIDWVIDSLRSLVDE